jgi:hypothetical protein
MWYYSDILIANERIFLKMSRSEELKKIIALCDYAVSSENTRVDWSIDFALFGFALSRLDEYIKEDRYFIFLKSFCDRFAAEKPPMNSLSAAAPVLVALEMYKRTKNETYLSLAASVMETVKRMPAARIFGETPHSRGDGAETPTSRNVGETPLSRGDGEGASFGGYGERTSASDRRSGMEMPTSRNVGETPLGRRNGAEMPTSQYGGEKNFGTIQGGSVKTADVAAFLLSDYMFLKYTADADGLDALVKKPKEYAKSLMDKKDNLFHRSFFQSRIFQNTKIHFPIGRNYPARENILALFALTLVAEGEDYIHREINETITKLTTAINNYRNVDGSYNAFFRNKRKSQSVGFLTNKAASNGESKAALMFGAPNFDPSVAAYYAACCLKNASAGIIDAGYAETGKNAYITAAESLVKESGAIYMPNNSKKSFFQDLLSVFSKGSEGNLFGIAGIVFAALEYEKI